MFPQIQHDSNWLHLHHFSFLVLSPAIKFSPISTLTVPALVLILLDCSAKSLQSCPTLCDPIDSSPPGSPVPGILQARILEWVAILFSNAWKWKVKSEVAQSCLILHDPMVCRPPDSSIHGIFQARVLEWGAIAFSMFYAIITQICIPIGDDL